MENLIIRTMTAEDARACAVIEGRSITPPWSEQGFLDALSQETQMLVAEEAGQVLGYVNMYISFEEGEITNVAVDPQARGRHVADALMRRTIEEAKKRGVERIILEVRAGNVPAIALYHKCGFQEIGIRKNFYEQPVEDARIMELTIC